MATSDEEVRVLNFTVTIESWGRGVSSIDDDALMDLAPMIYEFGGFGASAAAGGLAGGPSATFTVLVPDAYQLTPPSAILGEVCARSVDIFAKACEKVGLDHNGIARVDVMEETYADRELDQSAESYLGVSELASVIGVSRQRVSELRTRGDFPAPVAELAAGPVWASSSLSRFLETWERKPGRPLKVRNPKAERVRSPQRATRDRIASDPRAQRSAS